MPERTPTLVKQWIALLDAAEHLRQTADPQDPCAMRRVGMAIDSLFRFEHTLTDAQREMARRTLWLRDTLEPLPADTSEWHRCRCRSCLLARRLGRFSQVTVTPRASVDTPAPGHEPSSPPPQTEAQGALFPCSC